MLSNYTWAWGCPGCVPSDTCLVTTDSPFPRRYLGVGNCAYFSFLVLGFCLVCRSCVYCHGLQVHMCVSCIWKTLPSLESSATSSSYNLYSSSSASFSEPWVEGWGSIKTSCLEMSAPKSFLCLHIVQLCDLFVNNHLLLEEASLLSVEQCSVLWVSQYIIGMIFIALLLQQSISSRTIPIWSQLLVIFAV